MVYHSTEYLSDCCIRVTVLLEYFDLLYTLIEQLLHSCNQITIECSAPNNSSLDQVQQSYEKRTLEINETFSNKLQQYVIQAH